jgi:hypothetical protein
MFAASQKKEADMEYNCDAESNQDEREQQGGQRPAMEMRPERSREQSDSCEGDENGTGAHPTLRPRFREDSMTCWHGAAALADYEPMGGGESWTKETVSGNYAPIPSPPSQDAMPRRGESQYAISRGTVQHFC